jgi:hypothetical protein
LRAYHHCEAGRKVLSQRLKSLKQTLFPCLRLNRETFLIDVNLADGIWTSADEWDFPDANQDDTDVHPLRQKKRWPDLSAHKVTQDGDARKLAMEFLCSIEVTFCLQMIRSRNVSLRPHGPKEN